MYTITFLKACTLSRISNARVTFYIQNCFYSELLENRDLEGLPTTTYSLMVGSMTLGVCSHLVMVMYISCNVFANCVNSFGFS